MLGQLVLSARNSDILHIRPSVRLFSPGSCPLVIDPGHWLWYILAYIL